MNLEQASQHTRPEDAVEEKAADIEAQAMDVAADVKAQAQDLTAQALEKASVMTEQTANFVKDKTPDPVLDEADRVGERLPEPGPSKAAGSAWLGQLESSTRASHSRRRARRSSGFS
ncbi:hypothetical protein [Streptomyces sp. NBC_01244]|uniref:hypothetical protein n=1 Tax=Streptomyces sp. NBC_01244 TaxID=2903797 RepID=UPI002E130604|nr:hypothetical protein OG247_01495 [Streptomyces sp. NBC_01244]